MLSESEVSSISVLIEKNVSIICFWIFVLFIYLFICLGLYNWCVWRFELRKTVFFFLFL